MKKLEGIVAPMATALAPDGHIDEKRTRILVDFLIDGGIDALFPLGTSGEFALLNDEERRTVIRTVVDRLTAGSRYWRESPTPVSPMWSRMQKTLRIQG